MAGDPILTDGQLRRLAEHKYSSSGTTLLDPFMQKFWNWFVLRIPDSIAPNLLTITGLLINAVTTLILIIYSPDARHDVCVVPLLLVHAVVAAVVVISSAHPVSFIALLVVAAAAYPVPSALNRNIFANPFFFLIVIGATTGSVLDTGLLCRRLVRVPDTGCL